MIRKTNHPNIYKNTRNNHLFTRNLTPGYSSYGEVLITYADVQYREWNPHSSKLSAAIRKGLVHTFLSEGAIVLYLGASSGTTVSHVSDIVGKTGFVFALERAPAMMRNLILLAQKRPNIAPVLADANQPRLYEKDLLPIDWLYQDIAQKNQVEIFLKNLKFLKKNKYAFLIIKARSINVAENPSTIFDTVKKEIEKQVVIIQTITLEPYQKDHCLFVCQKIVNAISNGTNSGVY